MLLLVKKRVGKGRWRRKDRAVGGYSVALQLGQSWAGGGGEIYVATTCFFIGVPQSSNKQKRKVV